MFYGQCNDCGQRRGLGTVSTCVCEREHTTKDEALDLALEALEQIDSAMPFPVGSRAITAIKQALAAQPAPVQEPVGYLEIDDIESQREYPHNCRNVNLWHEGGQGMAAIYTTPPAQRQWVGLTDDEMKDALLSVDAETKRLPPGMKAFAQAILAKSKENNT